MRPPPPPPWVLAWRDMLYARFVRARDAEAAAADATAAARALILEVDTRFQRASAREQRAEEAEAAAAEAERRAGDALLRLREREQMLAEVAASLRADSLLSYEQGWAAGFAAGLGF